MFNGDLNLLWSGTVPGSFGKSWHLLWSSTVVLSAAQVCSLYLSTRVVLGLTFVGVAHEQIKRLMWKTCFPKNCEVYNTAVKTTYSMTLYQNASHNTKLFDFPMTPPTKLYQTSLAFIWLLSFPPPFSPYYLSSSELLNRLTLLYRGQRASKQTSVVKTTASEHIHTHPQVCVCKCQVSGLAVIQGNK